MIKRATIWAFVYALMLFQAIAASELTEYRLKKDDVIRMTVYQEADLSTEAQLGKTGSASFPLIGNVSLLGLTLKEAELKIKDLYEQDYLVSAQINLMVMAYAEKWVIVGGEVRQPGTIKMPEDGALDLRGAIAQAGGLVETANSSQITLRCNDGNVQTLSLEGSGNTILKHGDSITVARISLDNSTVTVSGQVQKPGLISYPRTGRLDIVTAIALAGDFTRIANTRDVLVRRDSKQYTISLKDIRQGNAEMFYLRPGDLIIAQESRW